MVSPPIRPTSTNFVFHPAFQYFLAAMRHGPEMKKRQPSGIGQESASLGMTVILMLVVSVLLGNTTPLQAAASLPAAPDQLSPSASGGPPVSVVVIPIRQQIAKPVLYVLRRGLKQAIERRADVVILDMKTPGGALDVTFEIMEALDKFPGRTITFVNTEAISAGAFISAVTDDIFFTPDGVMGAAAPVMAFGGEIDASMKQKIVSYLKARVRAISEGKGYRGQVISAMIDADYELKIGETVLKPKGELLSLTAAEASATYGNPAQPLLAAGITPNIETLLTQSYGAGRYQITQLEVTWSEHCAEYLNRFSSVLLGLGLLALFIEFKTPGFGLFGFTGILLLLTVFFGHSIAGLSGHEPVLFFALGLALVVIELVFFPGVVLIALTGIGLILGSLVWSMADLWPNEPVTFSGDVFIDPLTSVALGISTAIVMAFLLLRFLPRGWFWDRMILSAAITSSTSQVTTSESQATLIGRTGLAVTPLYPSGHIEIDGHHYEARLAMGSAENGSLVVVTAQTEFGIIVEKA